jgi:hypothetical protein
LPSVFTATSLRINADMVKLSLLPALCSVTVTANVAVFAGLREVIPTVSSVLSSPWPDHTSVIPFQNATLATRQISDDPYCPGGFNCDPERCSFECPEGQYCLTFRGEGAHFCIWEGQTFCSVDTTKGLGFGCSRSGAECWYVNYFFPCALFGSL